MSNTFPVTRKRRLRNSTALRRLVAETSLLPEDLVAPLFVVDGATEKHEIPSMPGQYHHTLDSLVHECERLYSLHISAVLLFGVTGKKDQYGVSGSSSDGIVQRAVAAVKKAVPDLLVITDVCLCEYTDHGHCGVLNGTTIDNDATLPYLAQIALSHAHAGADMVAPSDMMDGRVQFIRTELDAQGFTQLPIMAYSAKYASSFYGPFRDAAQSAPSFGNRKSYQMQPKNVREALDEVRLDIDEGADIVMVKPALPYLDVISQIRAISTVPVSAYNVSGEYTMIHCAADKGFIDKEAAMMEVLTSIKRAGADIIISYFAADAASHILHTYGNPL